MQDRDRVNVAALTFHGALQDFDISAKRTMDELKPEINNFLWERLPSNSTLYEMEELATNIYQLIDDHFDAMRNKLEGKEPGNMECTNCLEDFNATIRGIWGGKAVCPKCFIALIERGKPEALKAK
jgi:hypothetical protein